MPCFFLCNSKFNKFQYCTIAFSIVNQSSILFGIVSYFYFHSISKIHSTVPHIFNLWRNIIYTWWGRYVKAHGKFCYSLNTLSFFCFLCLIVWWFLSTRECSTHVKMSPLPLKGCKFWPMLGTYDHWAVRVLWRATLLWHGKSLYIGSEDPWHSHLMSSVWQWSCRYLF